jgi:PAS domain-containing protein
MDLQTWLFLLAYGVPALVALYGLWAKVARPRVAPYLQGILALGDIAGMRDDITLIKRELTHNGGKSVKDVVVRTEISGRHREAMLRAHFANNNEGQFETDAQGKLTWANETLQRWTGLAEHELRGKGLYSIIATADQGEFRHAFEEAIADGREFRWQCQIRSISTTSEDPTPRVVHIASDWRVMVVRDPSSPSAIVGYSGNVRRRKVTETKLRAVPKHMLQDDGA